MKLLIVMFLLISQQIFADDSVPAPAPAPMQEASPPIAAKERKMRTALFAYYSMADKVDFNSVVGHSGTVSSSGYATFNFDKAFGIGFESYNMAPSSWGYAIGVSYDFERKFNSASATMSGSSATAVYVNPKPTLSILTTYVNAIYQWESFYVPFGLNVSLPNFNSTDGSATTVTGGIGAQVGVGTQINEKFSVELLNRSMPMSVTRTVGTASFNYGTGYITGLQLQIKASF